MFETEFKFTLPKGYLDMNGVLHREGVMRLANEGDEIIPLKEPRVQQNPGYLSIIILSRVIKSLGTLPAVDTRVVEGLFTIDLATFRICIPESIPWICPCIARCVRIADRSLRFP